MSLKTFWRSLKTAVRQKSPTVWTVLGVGSFLTATVLAVTATPKALDLVTMAEDEKEDTLTPVETVKAAWKPYVPSAVAFVTGVACVSKARHIERMRYAELAGLYSISQACINRLEEKTEEIVGPEKARQIKREAMDTPGGVYNNVPPPPISVDNMFPYFDPLSNTAFYCTPQIVKEAVVELNRRLFYSYEPHVTIEDLYYELNKRGATPELKPTSLSIEFGWRQDDGGPQLCVDDDWVPTEMGHWSDGRPCYLMTFASGHQPVAL